MNRQEELWSGGGGKRGEGRAEEPSATGDRGPAAMSLTPAADGMQAHIFESSPLEVLHVGGFLCSHLFCVAIGCVVISHIAVPNKCYALNSDKETWVCECKGMFVHIVTVRYSYVCIWFAHLIQYSHKDFFFFAISSA